MAEPGLIDVGSFLSEFRKFQMAEIIVRLAEQLAMSQRPRLTHDELRKSVDEILSQSRRSQRAGEVGQLRAVVLRVRRTRKQKRQRRATRNRHQISNRRGRFKPANRGFKKSA